MILAKHLLAVSDQPKIKSKFVCFVMKLQKFSSTDIFHVPNPNEFVSHAYFNFFQVTKNVQFSVKASNMLGVA